MSQFNQAKKTGTKSAVKTTGETGTNHQGGKGYKRDAKSELFLLAVSNMVGKDTFYEDAKSRNDRFSKLSREIAGSDPAWFSKFVHWLRNEAYMRSASVVAAVEGAVGYAKMHGSKNSTTNWPRVFVSNAAARADEPGEILAYYTGKYGRKIPAAIKKGVADASKKLYNEYSLLKYDTPSHDFRFGDVLQLTHPVAKSDRQNNLFKYALDRRYGNEGDLSGLHMLANRQFVNEVPVNRRRKMLRNEADLATLREAGMTWEALAGWLQGPMDAEAWEAVIPNMGYMALLRNLRNFEEAGISQEAAESVSKRLADKDEVARSKQFPFRFLSAYRAVEGLTYVSALEQALQHSLSNVPSLSGRSLILVDRSGSMFGGWLGRRNRDDLDDADKAAIFGSALALRAEKAELVQFGTSSKKVPFRKGASVLKMLEKFDGMGGTNTAQAVRTHLRDHDRVVIVTDEQASIWGSDPADVVPAKTPVYTWNLAGYEYGQNKSGEKRRHTFGGLTDRAFDQIPLLEAGYNQSWPWDS